MIAGACKLLTPDAWQKDSRFYKLSTHAEPLKPASDWQRLTGRKNRRRFAPLGRLCLNKHGTANQVRFATIEIDGVIHLVVAGAAVQLADVYDRPIALIHRLILRYWKRDQTPEAAAVATGQSA